MAVKSNIAYNDFPDIVTDTAVTNSPVLDVFRGTANVVYIEASNSADSSAFLSIYDSLTPTVGATTPVFEAPIPNSSTLRCSCLLEFSNGVSYAATSSAGGSSAPSGTITLTLVGAV